MIFLIKLFEPFLFKIRKINNQGKMNEIKDLENKWFTFMNSHLGTL